jgi:hypothetical protein
VETKRCISYEEGELFVGWLEDHPDCRTQGETLGEPEENLPEINSGLSSEKNPCGLKVGELSFT